MLTLEVGTPRPDCWFAIDQLGFAIQAFGRKNAHQERKAALGLPRKIHGPKGKPMKHQNHERHRQPEPLKSGNGRKRHAAPGHYHLTPCGGGTLAVRMTAFPSPDLPDIKTSRMVLEELRNHLQSEMEQRSQTYANRGTRPPKTRPLPSGPRSEPSGAAVPLPRPCERVEAVLLEERTKKGGWKAKRDASGLQGPVQNSGDVHGDAAPGQGVELVVASVNVNRCEIAFRWPTDRDAVPARPGRPTADRRSRSRSGGR